MSRSASFPCLDRVTPPLDEINRIWISLRQIDWDYITTFIGDVPLLSTRRVDWYFLRAAVTFWDPIHAIFNIQGTELTPIIEEYRTLIADRIDAALASVVLQVVGGREYEVGPVAETILSLDRVTRTTDRRLRGSPILLQIWLQSPANPFGLLRPVLFFSCSGSIISQLLSLIRVERKVSEWIKIFREIPPRSFKWRAAWMPPGPAALKCHYFNGVPLVSHAGSTTYFPARVMSLAACRQSPSTRHILDSNIFGGWIRHPWIAKETSNGFWTCGEPWSLSVPTSPSIQPLRNRISELPRNMSSASTGGVRQHTKISPTLHELKIADQREQLSPRTRPFK
ncbi:hypothetical protein CRG98_030040 [Punica granatum]|uniref:Uncharacterized protein n=1 Tax=Punica granatum TaxID=22663 RepID=A0A2I0J041_PUNGR|nr:hypothetical protein CRG98_030040 [Punica granatum]